MLPASVKIPALLLILIMPSLTIELFALATNPDAPLLVIFKFLPLSIVPVKSNLEPLLVILASLPL